MKMTIITLAMAFMALIPFVHQANAMDKKKMMHDTDKITAVMFYSENCGSCRIIDPRVQEAASSLGEEKVSLVKFDFSTRAKIKETKAYAAEIGMESLLQKYGARYGFAVLVDGEGNVLDTIKVDHDTNEIIEKMSKAVMAS